MRTKDFIRNEWANYADYDNRRSLPNVMDGLKITQRKAMYAAIKMPKNSKPVRVSQFASEASKETAYHHGERSMISTVVKLAQDYPGSNNYPLLEKHGQFGSRLTHESAAPRYIYTKLHDNWDILFDKEDQNIVEYLYDDEDKIEPKFFIPTLPVVLLNGADGVGNGFKSFILPYSKESVIKGLKELIKYNKVKTKLIPYIKGFTGKTTKDDKQVVFEGVITVKNLSTLVISEIPPSYDNEKYKIFLNKLVYSGFIKDYNNKSTEDKWEWEIKCNRSVAELDNATLLDKFGLIYKTTENFVGWGVDDTAPITFNSPEELLEYWYNERLKLYEKSIKYQIDTKTKEIIVLDLKIKFIKWCVANDFKKLTKIQFVEAIIKNIKGLTDELAQDFINTPIFRITADEVKKLENKLDEAVDSLDMLEKLTAIDAFKECINRM